MPRAQSSRNNTFCDDTNLRKVALSLSSCQPNSRAHYLVFDRASTEASAEFRGSFHGGRGPPVSFMSARRADLQSGFVFGFHSLLDVATMMHRIVLRKFGREARERSCRTTHSTRFSYTRFGSQAVSWNRYCSSLLLGSNLTTLIPCLHTYINCTVRQPGKATRPTYCTAEGAANKVSCSSMKGMAKWISP